MSSSPLLAQEPIVDPASIPLPPSRPSSPIFESATTSLPETISTSNSAAKRKDAPSTDTSISTSEPEAITETSASSQPPSMLEQVISSIFTPGTNPGLVKATNRAFMALFASLLFLLAVSGGNLHVVALLVIAGCLYGSIQWFITELEAARKTKAE